MLARLDLLVSKNRRWALAQEPALLFVFFTAKEKKFEKSVYFFVRLRYNIEQEYIRKGIFFKTKENSKGAL